MAVPQAQQADWRPALPAHMAPGIDLLNGVLPPSHGQI
jgi:hypothetical protein